jgi:hypothetical protein
MFISISNRLEVLVSLFVLQIMVFKTANVMKTFYSIYHLNPKMNIAFTFVTKLSWLFTASYPMDTRGSFPGGKATGS